MVELILPPHMKADGHPFAGLLARPQDFQAAATGIARVLAGSFAEDARRADGPVLTHTDAEERRRARLLFEWFRRFRGDLGYSLSMTLAELPRALRAELDGTHYEPPPKGRTRGVEGAQ
jgi:hypothetical protein